MTTPSNTKAVGWQKLREFAGVDLLNSYVLSWSVQRGTLSIDVDLQLTSEHPFYEKPRPAEKVCIRAAIIDFPYCEGVVVDDATVDESISDTISKLGIGAFEDLRRLNDRSYEIVGEFGTVIIDAERPILRLRGS